MPNIDAVFIVDSNNPIDNGTTHAIARVDGQILDPRQPEAPISLEDVGMVHFAMVRLPDDAEDLIAPLSLGEIMALHA